jgi:phenylacetate-CoA ligase
LVAPYVREAYADFMAREPLRRLQLARLQTQVRRVYEAVPLYRERYRAAGVTPDDIRSLDDIARLPFVVKNDLRDTYPFGMFAVPMSEIVRCHASSGTTGKPIVAGYTRRDIDVWSEVMMRTFLAAGVTSSDIVQNAWGYGLFTGGLGAHYGLERLGAAIIPMSGGNTDKQIMLLEDFGVTVMCCTPTYFLFVIERAKELGKDLRQFPVKTGVFGAEPWTEAMRREIEAGAGVRAFDIYGLTEIIGPGVSAECEAVCGLHIFEDHFYPEIINPETGAVLPPGEQGELVLTTLTKEGLPMVRYRTRDITRLHVEPCACGRTLCRMDRVTHRSDDMLIIRGVNLFPSQVEAALLSIPGAAPHYQLIVDRVGVLDDLEVRVEVTPEVMSDEVRRMEAFQRLVQERLETVIGLRVRITLVEPKGIERSVGKARRVIDNRPK